MANIERRINKDGNTSSRAKVRRKGHSTQTATFTRLTDARKWVQITEAAILEGRHFKTAESKRHTLGDMIDRYIREVLPQKGVPTKYNQTQQLRWWKAQFGGVLLADVTPSMIAEYRDQLAKHDGTLRSNATVRRYMAALSHAFTVTVKEWGWLDESPMRQVSKPKEPRGRVRFLSDDERERLWSACQASENHYIYLVVVVALSTGARKMEIMGLTWADIDFDRRVIVLHDTKNGERRVLPLVQGFFPGSLFLFFSR